MEVLTCQFFVFMDNSPNIVFHKISLTPLTFLSTEYTQQCRVVSGRDCSTEVVAACSTAVEEECSSLQQRECVTVQQQQCRTETQQMCSTQTQQVCETVNDHMCSAAEVNIIELSTKFHESLRPVKCSVLIDS